MENMENTLSAIFYSTPSLVRMLDNGILNDRVVFIGLKMEGNNLLLDRYLIRNLQKMKEEYSFSSETGKLKVTSMKVIHPQVDILAYASEYDSTILN